MVSIGYCACVFASPIYLTTPPKNHLRMELKVRSNLYLILLMVTLTRCCLLVIFLPLVPLYMMRLLSFIFPSVFLFLAKS